MTFVSAFNFEKLNQISKIIIHKFFNGTFPKFQKIMLRIGPNLNVVFMKTFFVQKCLNVALTRDNLIPGVEGK